MTRKLIRPDINEIKRLQKKDVKKRPPPPSKTNAENYYYLKQMSNKTPLVFELTTGEMIKGTLEWYDESCLKIKKSDGSNLIVYKHVLKFISKDLKKISESE